MDTLAAYNHYEVSNFALAGFESRHNQIYWRNDEYIGVGPGAYSFLDGVRARNAKNIPDYERNPGIKIEELHLSEDEVKLETMIQYLRTRAGLPKERYRDRFGREAIDDFAEALDRLLERGLIAETAQRFYPTRKGYELNDEIGLELIPIKAPH